MGYVRTVPRGGFCVVGKRRESPSGVRFAREKARAKIGIDDSPSVCPRFSRSANATNGMCCEAFQNLLTSLLMYPNPRFLKTYSTVRSGGTSERVHKG